MLLFAACNKQNGSTRVATPSKQTTVAAPTNALHVHPGEDIQTALDKAAAREEIDSVVVHTGTYSPPEHRQALIWFNARHDGLHLKAEGNVTLTAANTAIANSNHESFPAVVNHVVYFGDGVSSNTKLSGFRITGANNFVTTKKGPPVETDSQEPRLAKTSFFYTNGGAIKIFGRSYPMLENLQIVDNYSSPCGGGVSIEHRGFTDDRVTIRNCVFENNRSPLTGSAIDLLDHEYGSAVLVENCLFANNLSNCSLDSRSTRLGTWNPETGHGAVTVFAFSKAEFRRCTFINNRNGLDDLSQESSYRDCIFWRNNAIGGWAEGERYDLDVANAKNVEGCFISGNSYTIDPTANMLEASDPQFDKQLTPRNSAYANVGFRAAGNQLGVTVDAIGTNGPQVSPSSAEKEVKTLHIQVDGKEFGWNIRYPGEDNVLGTDDDPMTRRHLHVPSGTDVRLTIGSEDYLYQFTLPKHSVREVAIPGMTHRSSLLANEPGVYPLVGDQFCGYTHPDLIGKLIVQNPQEFKKWLSNQPLTKRQSANQ